MGFGELASLRSWQVRLGAMARWIGLRDELAAVPDGHLAVRPFRFVVALWLLWGPYAVVKVYRGWENLPANGPGWYLLVLGVLYLLWRLARDERVQRQILRCLEDVDSRAAVGEWERGGDLNTSTPPLPLSPSPSCASIFWFTSGLFLVIANLALLQWRHPYTFTHDDNLSQFLPVILHGARSLFDHGVFPTWNPHQFAGAPTASLGIYALTYPPTYASYAAARWLLGNENATLEVFGAVHLLAGYVTMFWAARTIGLRPSLAAAAGLCFALCGFFLIAGRSWYYMLPLATWLPLLAVALWRMSSGPVGWRWMIGTGILLGILFHAGNAQMWIYSVSFLGLAALYLVLYGGQPRQIFVPVFFAALLGLAIAMPLFLPQYLETAGLKRFAGGESITGGLFGLLVPWPLSFAERPGMVESSDVRFATQFYYAGTIFTMAAAIGIFSCALHRWPRRVAGANVFLALALVAFIYALGRPGMAWGLTGELPVFKQFRHPMKYLAFVHLFGILGGGLILERLLRRFPRPRHEWIVAAACAVLMSYHTFLALPAFFTWGIRPYPAAPAWLANLGTDPTARLYPVAPRRSTAADYEQSQMVNLPTIYGTLSLTGYDPLLEENRQHRQIRQSLIDRPLETLRALGIRHLVVYPPQELPRIPAGQAYSRWYFWEPSERSTYQAARQAGRLMNWSPGAALYEIDGAAPLAFVEKRPSTPLPIRFDATGASLFGLRTQSDEPLIVNIVPSRFFIAWADGKKIPWRTDDWGRLKLSPPAGTQSIRLQYSPPWLAGSLLGTVLAIGSLGGFALVQRWVPPTAKNGSKENQLCDAP